MNDPIAFVMPCCNEPTLQVAWALACVREQHPHAAITLVVDGPETDRFDEVARTLGVGITNLPDGPLKRIKFGGRWLHEVLAAGHALSSHYQALVKLDPDTYVSAPVAPPAAPYSGCRVNRQLPGDPVVLCHALVAFQHTLVDELLRLRPLLDARHVGIVSAVKPGSDVVSEEIVMANLCSDLGIRATHWDGIDPVAHIQGAVPAACFLHSVVPYQPQKFLQFSPAAWYRELCTAECVRFAASYPHLLTA